MEAVALALLLCVAGAGAYIAVPWGIVKLIRMRFLRRMDRSASLVLTFDDGPSADTTPAILELLDRARIRATFFLVGRAVENHPELTEAIIQRGHEIGEHGYGHRHPWKTGPLGSLMDLVRGSRALDRYIRPGGRRLLRPPFGKLNAVSLLYAFLTGRRLVFWNVDPRDYGEPCADRIAAYVVTRARPGAVILLHDGRPPGAGSRQQSTVEAVQLILDDPTLAELRTATVGEALRLPSGEYSVSVPQQ